MRWPCCCASLRVVAACAAARRLPDRAWFHYPRPASSTGPLFLRVARSPRFRTTQGNFVRWRRAFVRRRLPARRQGAGPHTCRGPPRGHTRGHVANARATAVYRAHVQSTHDANTGVLTKSFARLARLLCVLCARHLCLRASAPLCLCLCDVRRPKSCLRNCSTTASTNRSRWSASTAC